jgi:class 3 adenylate cyclase/tetratricopeptide (TPR) repeat protein
VQDDRSDSLGIIAGRYQLLEVLGRAGASEVVRALDAQHDRVVALKMRRVTPQVSREQLLAEGRQLLRVRPHPALPTVRDDFFLDDDTYVLVMDWVEGTPLGRFIEERGDPGLPVGSVLTGLEAIAAALDHLHEHDPPIIHGDVRPENVLVGPGGRLALVFGVGSTGSASVDNARPFRAPELAHLPASRASDVFGLAATAVFALTGRPPPDGPIEWEGVAPELTRRIDRVFRRALDPDPRRRPPSASDFVERLESARETTVPAGVVTFVLTDIEGSTDLWDAHPRAMTQVVPRHYELVADVAERHGGRMPRSQGEGDSTLSAYARASDAIDAVLALQKAFREEDWPDGIDLRIRAGLHTGEAQVEHGDYLGATINRAARVRALARGGQVLLSQATAELVADRLPEGVTLGDLGRVKLKGLDREEEVYQLVAPELVADAPSPAAGEAAKWHLPYPITLPADRASFVDRVAELDVVGEQWTVAVADRHRRVVAVAGDPGIGKTRFVAEVACGLFEEAGATVLHGRCYEENLVPYQPFVEILEQIVRTGAPAEVRAEIVRSGTLLARLAPDISIRFPDLPDPAHAEPSTERYMMFAAVDAFLSGLARRVPLLVVLEDLHWADRPTVALLAHLARSAEAVPMLILGTYRASEVEREHPVAAALVDLRREGLVASISLSGLDEAGVARLVATTCDLAGDPDLVHSVSRETAGNPFFVHEICSHLAESGVSGGAFTLETLGVPEGVKQVIGRRIARLPDGAERLLSIGSVIGREFDLDVLLRVSGDGEDVALDRIEDACAARLLEEVAGSIGRYSFVHALTKEALYDSLSATRRARLHHRVAEALESARAAEIDDHLGELAFHYAAAGAELPKAVMYARRAGELALRQLAHEEAAVHFDRGLAVLQAHDGDRCDLLLGLAEARRRAGDVPGSQQAFADAGALAREIGDADRLAQAAIGSFRGHVLANPGWHEPTIALLEEALAALPADDSTLRSRVLAALALELYFTSEHARGVTTGAEAIAIARRLGDDDALAFALACDHTAISDPAHPLERLSVSTELIAVGERLGNSELALVGHVHRACDLLEQARVEEARREAAAAARIVEELGQPMHRYFVMWLESTLELLAGRFDHAERLSNEALDIAVAADHPDAFVVWGTQALVLAWQRGDARPLLEPARALLGDFPDLSTWPAAVALVEATSGEIDAARARLLDFAADLDALTFGGTWMPAMLALAEVARIADEPVIAPHLYERLLPYAGQLAVVSLNLSEFGPVSRGLGVLATLTGDHARAERHFRDALALSREIVAPAHAARTLTDHAGMLQRRAGRGDHARARELLEEAAAIAADLGMGGLLSDIGGLRSSLA